MATQKEVDELQAQIAKLTSELDAERSKRSEAEELAHSMAAGNFVDSMAEEQPTGKTVMVRVCVNPHVRDEKKQIWKEIEYPTYFYNIQLPAGAAGSNGSCLSTNGLEFHHGQTYELDPFMLAEVKSRVARTWDHEKSIHGDNENAYRKPTQKHFMSKAAAARGN